MTSSAASEADSARKSVSGACVGRAADDRHAAAVGHVDVEQDDVGALRGDERDGLLDARGLAHELDVALELGAHAGAEEPVVVDDGDARHAAPGSVSSTSVPAPGAEWIAARPPWRAMRPTIDSRTPRRSSGTRGRVEARAAVAHEDLQRVVGRLGVDVDGRAAAELRRVDHRLARGGHERLAAPVERAVADDHDLDRHAVRALDLAGHRLERGGEPVVVALAAGQPRAQLALLRARQGGHRARVVGALLHERERLQDRVVQVRPHLGARLRADALLALGGQRAHQPHGPRREDDPEHGGHDEHGEDRRRARRSARGWRRGRRCRRR